MGGRKEITGSLEELWGRTKTRWTGGDAEFFYQKYIAEMLEMTEIFESACQEVEDGAVGLSEQLELLEREIDEK